MVSVVLVVLSWLFCLGLSANTFSLRSSRLCRPRPRPSSALFSRVACPHPCTRPCPSLVLTLILAVAVGLTLALRTRHLHHSHLGYCPCVVAVSYSPCLYHSRRVVVLIVVHAIIPVFVIVLTLIVFVPVLATFGLIALAPSPALCSPYSGVGFPLYADAGSPHHAGVGSRPHASSACF